LDAFSRRTSLICVEQRSLGFVSRPKLVPSPRASWRRHVHSGRNMLAPVAAVRTAEGWQGGTTEAPAAFDAVPPSDDGAILDALPEVPRRRRDGLSLGNVQYHFRRRAGWPFEECTQHPAFADPSVVPTAFV